MNDNIREQYIKDLLRKAEKVRLERAITYENSFLECYNAFGINYILGEIFNCSKRIEILRKDEDWNKLEDVMFDLINWSLLTGVCLKTESDKRVVSNVR